MGLLAGIGYQQNWIDVLGATFMRHAFIGGTLVALASGLIGYFVVVRRDAFAAHALAHIGFPGATGAALVGAPVTLGLAVFCVAGGLAIGAFGKRVDRREVATGTVLAFAGHRLPHCCWRWWWPWPPRWWARCCCSPWWSPPAAAALALTAPMVVVAGATAIALGSVWGGLVISAMFNLPPSFPIVSLAFATWLAALARSRSVERTGRAAPTTAPTAPAGTASSATATERA
nr:metal ABC transporter permease [Candidatus Microthrix sp.]